MGQTMRSISGVSADKSNYTNRYDRKTVGSVAIAPGLESIESAKGLITKTIVCPNVPVTIFDYMNTRNKMNEPFDKLASLSASDALVEQLSRRNRNTIASMEQGFEEVDKDNKEITTEKEQEGTRRILPDITTR